MWQVSDVSWTDAALASLVESDAATPGVAGVTGRKGKCKTQESQGKSPIGGKNVAAPTASPASAKASLKNGNTKATPTKKASKTKSKKVLHLFSH